MQPPKNSDQSRKKRKVDRKDRKPEVLEDEDLRVRAPSARARQNRGRCQETHAKYCVHQTLLKDGWCK